MYILQILNVKSVTNYQNKIILLYYTFDIDMIWFRHLFYDKLCDFFLNIGIPANVII